MRVEIDLGDVVAIFNLRVKGMRHLRAYWVIGVPINTEPADRVFKPPAHASTGRIDLRMDLQADKKVSLSVGWTDEVENPVDAPADATAIFTVDDPSIINLTDNGDGTAVAAATGTLGTANIHGVFTGNGLTLTGDLQIVVVAGLAERAAIVAGAPEEVTPDA